METPIILEKTHTVHLKPDGEICNRLKAGVRMHPVQRKGDWIRITWRNGKKKGWIHYPQEVRLK
ncbi:MAG: hypothetical protein IID18_00165 [Nitrospinae bacterium]|nr:hypothetical protein [Nitrospinota bacterium]